MSPPLVTAYIPSYNKARFVEAALESVRCQTFRDFELIVVDDCSTDDSVDIIERWLDTSGFPCRFIRHPVNEGVCRTCNEVLALARGRYIAGPGADDVWHPAMLERLVARMETLPDDVAVIYSDAEIIDEKDRVSPLRFIDSCSRRFDGPPEGRIFDLLIEGNFIPAMAALARTECLLAVGGYDETLWYEDWDMWLRLADRYAFAFLPEVLAQYRIVGGSMVRSKASRPLLLQSEGQILLKWLGRDPRTDELVARASGNRAELMYIAGHSSALGLAKRKLRQERRARDLLMVLCLRLGIPYSGFRRVDVRGLALKRALKFRALRWKKKGRGVVRGGTPGGGKLRSVAWQSRLWKRYRRWQRRSSAVTTRTGPIASILLVTHNRLGMLKECVSSILANTSAGDYELIAWDNASTDGTGEYLDAIASSSPQVRVVHHAENIGINGIAACVRLAHGEYLVAIDDDVVEVPSGWLSEMIRAFEIVPRAGYLATNVVQDETTNGARPIGGRYRTLDYGDGVVVEHGATGGWCTITSREVVSRIGNFLEMPGRTFFLADGDFARRCKLHLYRVGVLRDVRVYHAAGVAKNKEYGYLKLCQQKYSEAPEYETMLAATLAALDRSDET